MRYFGVYSLESVTTDVVKQQAEERGKNMDDICTYDELFDF